MIITKAGKPSKRLSGAIAQVKDWKDYVERNRVSIQRDLSRICEERDLLGWDSKYGSPRNMTGDYLKDPKIYIRFSYHIIIGRRSKATAEVRRWMNQYRSAGELEIGTHDRFLDLARKLDQHDQNPEESIHLHNCDD